MEINSNLNASAVNSPVSAGASVRAARPSANDRADFPGAAGLEQNLQQTPEVRAEAVARAKALVANPDYPPLETIKRIANLLAINNIARPNE